jgi:hypothetical protein
LILNLSSLGIDVHSIAEPTKLETLKREYEKQIVETKEENKKKLLEKYGGEVSDGKILY